MTMSCAYHFCTSKEKEFYELFTVTRVMRDLIGAAMGERRAANFMHSAHNSSEYSLLLPFVRSRPLMSGAEGLRAGSIKGREQHNWTI